MQPRHLGFRDADQAERLRPSLLSYPERTVGRSPFLGLHDDCIEQPFQENCVRHAVVEFLDSAPRIDREAVSQFAVQQHTLERIGELIGACGNSEQTGHFVLDQFWYARDSRCHDGKAMSLRLP